MATSKVLFQTARFGGIVLFLLFSTLSVHAQFLRTSYFMEGTHYR